MPIKRRKETKLLSRITGLVQTSWLQCKHVSWLKDNTHGMAAPLTN